MIDAFYYACRSDHLGWQNLLHCVSIKIQKCPPGVCWGKYYRKSILDARRRVSVDPNRLLSPCVKSDFTETETFSAGHETRRL